MGTVRRWVFPIVWMIILGAASLALVKIAFFPDSAADADPTVPTGELTEPTVVVARGTITNDLTLQGTVAADPAVPMKATAAGTVDDVYIQQGAAVATGDLVYDIRVETPATRSRPRTPTARSPSPSPSPRCASSASTRPRRGR